MALSYQAGYDRGIGNTDASGTAITELFGNGSNIQFKATYGGTSATIDVAVAGDGTGQAAGLDQYRNVCDHQGYAPEQRQQVLLGGILARL